MYEFSSCLTLASYRLREPIETAWYPEVSDESEWRGNSKRGTKSQRILQTQIYHRLPHYISVALSITQPSGKFSLRLIWSVRGTRKGIGTNVESVKVVRRTGYRKSFSVPIRFRLLTEVVGTYSPLCCISDIPWELTSLSLFLSTLLFYVFSR